MIKKLTDILRGMFKKIRHSNRTYGVGSDRSLRPLLSYELFHYRALLFLYLASSSNGYGSSFGGESKEVSVLITIVLCFAFISVLSLLIGVMGEQARKKRIVGITILAVSLLTNGCATPGQSIGLGAGIGTGLGTAIGYGINQDATGTLIGAGVGALVGGLLGVAGHEEKKTKEELMSAVRKRDISRELPSLRAPEASCTEMPEYVQSNKYYGPQIQCMVEKGASWSR